MSILSSLIQTNNKLVKIDPMVCIVKLAILSFLPDGTKISFFEDTLSFQPANVYQGISRFAYGDRREDVHNLLMPIFCACEWYAKRADMRLIFDKAVFGIEKLKTIYKDNPIVYQCLHYYIIIIENSKNKHTQSNDKDVNVGRNKYVDLPLINKEIDDTSTDDKLKAYICYENIWNDEEILIICQLFRYMSSQTDKDKINILQLCIDNILKLKIL